MKVLVAYGSKRGGTGGLAEMVGRCLENHDIDVDVRAASTVDGLTGYDAVVIGGGLYAGRWHHDSRSFVHRFRVTLRDVPVWFFSSGPLDDSANKKSVPATPQVQRLMESVDAVGHRTFGGYLAPDAHGFPASAMAKTRSGDWRDEEQIQDWVDSIAHLLPDLVFLPAGSGKQA